MYYFTNILDHLYGDKIYYFILKKYYFKNYLLEAFKNYFVKSIFIILFLIYR